MDILPLLPTLEEMLSTFPHLVWGWVAFIMLHCYSSIPILFTAFIIKGHRVLSKAFLYLIIWYDLSFLLLTWCIMFTDFFPYVEPSLLPWVKTNLIIVGLSDVLLNFICYLLVSMFIRDSSLQSCFIILVWFWLHRVNLEQLLFSQFFWIHWKELSLILPKSFIKFSSEAIRFRLLLWWKKFVLLI